MTWTMGRLMDLATGYWPAAALMAAVELDLFEPLRDGARAPAAGLASACGGSERGLRELLDALVALEVLVRDDAGAYAIAPAAAPLLDPASPACALGALRYNRDLYPLWGRLADAVRAGTPVLPAGAHLGDDPARTRRFVLGMHSRALGLAPALLPAMALPPAGTAGPFRLLDVGSGPGTFSRMLAEAAPRLQVLQLDLPPVLAVAHELAAASPARDRIEYHPADYRKDPLPGPVDGVLYCGALHQEDEASARALFGRLHGALREGGALRVVDLMIAPGRRGPAFAHLFSLQMLLTSPRGRVFGEDETAVLLAEAGFRDLETRRCDGVPYSVISARR
jgi:SAM-dependent methyltransferase